MLANACCRGTWICAIYAEDCAVTLPFALPDRVSENSIKAKFRFSFHVL